MACAKGLPCPLEPLEPYTPILNEKFVKAGDNQLYWVFPESRYDPKLKTMVPGFEILFDYDNKPLELKKDDTNGFPVDWANYMDPDAMTTLLGDAICNIVEEEYWATCQHALKSPYEVRTYDEDEEGGETPSDDDEGSNSKSDNSSDNSSSDSRDSGDNNSSDSDSDNSNSEDYDSQDNGNDRGEPFSDIEDEDVGFFYKDHFNNGVDYNDGDIEDDAKAGDLDIKDDVKAEDEEIEDNAEAKDVDIEDDAEAKDVNIEEDAKAKGIAYDEYPYRQPLDWSCIIDVSLRSGPKYDKHGREIHVRVIL